MPIGRRPRPGVRARRRLLLGHGPGGGPGRGGRGAGMGLNLREVLRQTARRQPDRPALLGPGPGDVLTYAALDEAIRQAGARLAGAGVGPGACIGLFCRSGISYIVATYAAWQAGACVVPIPVELARPER